MTTGTAGSRSDNVQIIRDLIASLESEYGASAALRVTKHLAWAYGALRKLEETHAAKRPQSAAECAEVPARQEAQS